MATVIRLILLFILFLTSQSGIAITTEFTVHQYDVNHIAQSDEIYGYDTNINHRHCCQILLTADTQDWPFLTFVSDFIATKRISSPSKSPDFVVSPNGTAFTGGKGGANGQVDTIRIMNPTSARGRSPGYPNGYIKYQNNSGQGVDPYTGRTIPNSQSHFPIE